MKILSYFILSIILLSACEEEQTPISIDCPRFGEDWYIAEKNEPIGFDISFNIYRNDNGFFAFPISQSSFTSDIRDCNGVILCTELSGPCLDDLKENAEFLFRIKRE